MWHWKMDYVSEVLLILSWYLYVYKYTLYTNSLYIIQSISDERLQSLFCELLEIESQSKLKKMF